MSLTFGELFAGVGGFSIGFEQAGWQCRWQVEWDKHCQQVLARHWPEVARYGDVRDVAGGGFLLAQQRPSGLRRDAGTMSDDHRRVEPGHSDTARSVLAPVDCITFGSPCQDLSVAGKRAGLAGERSGLFHEAIRIIKEMRDATAGTLPRFAIWENVAGALSSNKGDDFLAVLDAFAEVGALDISWRLVDAQHFGVAQRRRRVFVVADFGGECAGSIHAEPAGVRWHPATSRATGQGAAAGVACGIGGDGTVAGPLGGGNDGGHRADLDGAGAYVVRPAQGYRMTAFGQYADDDTASAMKQRDYKDATDLVVEPSVLRPFNPYEPRSALEENWALSDVKACLRADASAVSHALVAPSSVRRLTPLECERLSGFPDEHTRYRADGTEQSDSQRYRQCGNAVVAPVAAWLAWNLRISLQQEKQ